MSTHVVLRGVGARPWLPPAVLALVVSGLALVPLRNTRDFYFWDDSAAVFLPTWRAIGLDLLSGTWPTLRPDLWMGGNWAAEAQFGLWNPVNLAVAVLVALAPDLALAAAAVKAFFMVLLALGAYLLAREYGSRSWSAVAVAAALPFTGFTLYYDSATWVAGLMAFAWTPWFWWAGRRCARGVANPLLVFVFGYLLITNGNPYGALAAVFVLAGLAAETVVLGNWSGLRRLVIVGACVGATVGVAFLPLVLTSSSGWRESSGLANDGFLVPDLSMIAATSTPSMLPFIRVWSGSGSTVPITYSAWFLVPLVPWLDWGVLRARARELTGVGVVLLAYTMLAFGPSMLWMFRWPARLLEYVFLALFVGFAVVLSHGLRTDGWRARASLTALLAGFGAWLALSANPEILVRHVIGVFLTVVLVGLLLLAVVRFPSLLPVVMVAGTAVVLVAQTTWSPSNRDVAVWRFPATVAELDAYAARFDEPVLQVATPALVPPEDRPDAWADLLFGSMPAAAGIENTASYTGLGYDEMSQTLCMNHTGATCDSALAVAFQPAGDRVRVEHLVDSLKSNTVVVQNALRGEGGDELPVADIPNGWTLAETTDRVTVLRREEPLPWPESRLSAVSDGVTADTVQSSDTREVLRVSTGAADGALQFARLAWPGYAATVNGIDIAVHENSQGLVELTLPADLNDAEVRLSFRVPGYGIAIPLLAVGFAIAVIQGVLWERAGRRTRPRAR